MAAGSVSPIALYYDDGAYQEQLQLSRGSAGRPMGLMGRQVAGKEFLDAYLSHGQWDELVALTPDVASAQSIKQTCLTHSSSKHKQRRLRVFSTTDLHSEFLSRPPASILHFPSPAEPRFAWARQAFPAAFAVSGVTHTLCTLRAIQSLQSMVTAPFAAYDRLVCTSQAVRDMVQETCHAYCEYLRSLHGGDPRPAIKLELIPLGVDSQRFQPPTTEQRTEQRQRFRVSDDELAVLFVGRLSHHAKAHPFPLFDATARAARETGQPIHLLLAGWASSERVLNEFRVAAEQITQNVRVTFLDGLQADVRSGVWHAADVFMSPADNFQETFGLVIIEAMASGLPVIASDWNGYRDLVRHGETGFLIPTTVVEGSLAGLPARLLTAELNYDQFLAASSQCVRVDTEAAAKALTQLATSVELRQQMGVAGRRRVEELFSWSRVIRQYEQMWDQQRDELMHARATAGHGSAPVAFPPLERLFAGYPTRWHGDSTPLVANSDALERLETLLALPLFTHAAAERCHDASLLKELLESICEPLNVAEILKRMEELGIPPEQQRPTLGWLMKYNLLTD